MGNEQGKWDHEYRMAESAQNHQYRTVVSTVHCALCNNVICLELLGESRRSYILLLYGYCFYHAAWNEDAV